jgi:riboflavin synthase
MFTGIVETMATVLEKTARGLTVSRPESYTDLTIGCSITVNGACLSVIRFDNQSMSFDVVPETWARTNLGDLEGGSKVNLERALAAQSRFEGHIVQGHIEGTATVMSLEKPTDSPWATLTIDLPEDIATYVVHKGSIAINGVSLTVAGIEGGVCKIALIPHTLDVTNLGLLKNGDKVNIETDVLARYVESILAKKESAQ